MSHISRSSTKARWKRLFPWQYISRTIVSLKTDKESQYSAAFPPIPLDFQFSILLSVTISIWNSLTTTRLCPKDGSSGANIEPSHLHNWRSWRKYVCGWTRSRQLSVGFILGLKGIVSFNQIIGKTVTTYLETRNHHGSHTSISSNWVRFYPAMFIHCWDFLLTKLVDDDVS